MERFTWLQNTKNNEKAMYIKNGFRVSDEKHQSL